MLMAAIGTIYMNGRVCTRAHKYYWPLRNVTIVIGEMVNSYRQRRRRCRLDGIAQRDSK